MIKSSGVGIGISTSSSLAKIMNGSLKIESEKGKSTQVTMEFESFKVDHSILEIENLNKNKNKKPKTK